MNRIDHLAWDAPLAAYEAQAAAVWTAYREGNDSAIKLFRLNLPRFLDPTITWLPRDVGDGEIADAALTLDDARLAIARIYSYADWSALVQLVTAVADERSPVREFEHAVEAVITGDIATLRAMLAANAALVRARSTRVTCHDPPVHGATLVHYLAANGVEGYRQKSPANAVDVAKVLFSAGAEADALAGMYGGNSPTLSMLVSSTPPARAGVQVPLTHVLLDNGADPNGGGDGTWKSPLVTALVFGFRDAAQALADRGAAVDTVVNAAGLGRIEALRELLPASTPAERHRALALAAICGQEAAVRLLVERGEDPNRMNPLGFHAHSAPIHQAACAGHLGTVKLLVELGARTDILDTIWKGTPLGWAEHCEQPAVVDYLRSVDISDSGTPRDSASAN